MKFVEAHNLLFRQFIEAEDIRRRVEELGAELRSRYAGKMPVFLGVLNGAFMFTADLVRAFGDNCEISFIKLSSYRDMQSTGDVSTLIGLEIDLRGRQVVIVEDIVDSGKTLHSLLPKLEQLDTESIEIAALLQKPEMMEYPLDIGYAGFRIPPHFVIGYGLDFNGVGRQLPDIYQLFEDESV